MKRVLPLVLFLTLAAPARGAAAPPTVSEGAGTMAAPGVRHGVVWLRYDASTQDGWLRRAVLTTDGDARTVRLDDGVLASASAVELTWDTAEVHDGTHVVSATVEDTAGDATF